MLIRDRWGIPDSPELTMEERFRTKYRGIRVSFGYPACPELADRKAISLNSSRGNRYFINRRIHDGARSVRNGYGIFSP